MALILLLGIRSGCSSRRIGSRLGSSDVHPGHQCGVPRLVGVPGRGRPGGRRGGRRAVHPDQARQAAGAVFDLGAALSRHRLLPARGSDPAHRRRPCRLRVRSDHPGAGSARSGDVHPAAPAERPPGSRRVGGGLGSPLRRLDGQRAAPSRQRRPAPPRGPLQGRARGRSLSVALRRAPRRARGQRVPRLAVRARGCPDPRWARGAGDDRLLPGMRQSPAAHRRGADAPLARHPLRAGHGVSRLPALVRRIQGHGPGLVREARPRRRVPRASSAGARTAPTRSSRPVSSSGSVPPAPAADRWNNTTSISPTRCRSSWKRPSSTSPAGCRRPPASAISAWPGASR